MALSVLGQRSLNATFRPEELVVRRSGEVVELQALRIAATLFTAHRHTLLHSRYRETDGTLVSLLDFAVRLGYTALAAELAAYGCTCSLASIRFYAKPFDDAAEFFMTFSRGVQGESLTWHAADALGTYYTSDLQVGTAWTWTCSPQASWNRVDRVGRFLRLEPDSLADDWMVGLTRAQQEANLPCIHAAFAVVARGGLDIANEFPRLVTLRILDAAVLFGKPSIVQALYPIIDDQMRVRPLTFWDMAAALDQPNVVEAAVCAGAHFARLSRTVVIHPGPDKYDDRSLFDLAILGGHLRTENVLCRFQMAWFHLDIQDLDWDVQWKYKVESFNDGQLHEEFREVALPPKRWNTVAYVVERALSRAGAKYGPALMQLQLRFKGISFVHELLTFVMVLPPGLWYLIMVKTRSTNGKARKFNSGLQR